MKLPEDFSKLTRFCFYLGVFSLLYYLLILLPVSYIQFGNYRKIGAPITGGWFWEENSSCNIYPVLWFKGQNVYVIEKKKVTGKIFEIEKITFKDKLVSIKAKYHKQNDRRIDLPEQKGTNVTLIYEDRGKFLNFKQALMDNKPMVRIKFDYDLLQCGYPNPWIHLVNWVFNSEPWQEPKTKIPHIAK